MKKTGPAITAAGTANKPAAPAAQGNPHALLKIAGMALLVLAVLAAAALLYLQPPTRQEVLAGDENSAIYSVLVAGGISEALVDATPGRVVMEYALPEGMDKQASWYYAFGAAAGIAPTTKTIAVQATVQGKAAERVTASTADAIEFAEGRMSEEEFNSRLEKK